ncbi:MAG: RNA 3'-terminal phosphate cyclase [Candidatus Aenigmarchaeota archaeon]|nr:RNA 3'-terminal phosphate cyclase [Candidatus Aenigmarchaeota archaeon]
MDFLDIDGSHMEGGGQILRLATGLSAITNKPIRVYNIRANRPKPGLKPQHLKGIEAVAKLCNAHISGFTEGSTKIEFSPEELCHDHLRIDIGTAGSIGLVFQSLMIPAILTDKPLEFEVTGGTDVSWSPSVTYFREVFCHFIKRMGVDTEAEIKSYGFYPKGGGRVLLRVHPGNLRSMNLTDRTRFVRYDILSVASESLRKAGVAERQSESAVKILGRKSECELREYVSSESPGSAIHTHAHFENTILGTTVLGEQGVPAENVGEECAGMLKKQVESGACFDRWMGDQILPYMALAPGKSSISVAEITNHARTSMWLIEQFLPVRFETEESGSHFIISSSHV